ncbi:MAG: L-threonylcarbamoyladenylate synthase [Candidatus Aenigmarchaeota archaeon]|nr:L-threonylcarbamoyladenylate synthase [Candidatus Aenigmarchaeota archaeon]
MVARIMSVGDKGIVEGVMETLRNHGIIAFPTETCYGLGGIYDFEDVRKKIYKIKRRSKQKILPTIVSSITVARKYATIPPAAERLVQVFYPRPLTIAVNKNFSFRVTSHPLMKRILRKLRLALIATSANISAEKENYEFERVKKLFSKRIDLIINTGDLPYNPPSTVYDIENFKMIREGDIKEEEIKEVLEAFGFLKG